MTAPTFDLQSHSTYSDGTLPPREVVARAAAAGVELLALTDHDTVDGVAEALEAAAATGGALRVVPATELSSIDGDHEDLHILGYGIDHTNPAFLEALTAFRADRGARADRMAGALTDLGWALDTTVLEQRRAAGLPIGRPHLAQAAFDHPNNAARIEREGLADFGKLLEAYLIPGAPAYRRRSTPTVGEAIAAIHAAGGLAVWAHPFWDVDDPAEVVATIARFAAEHALDGVEAFYTTHTPEQTAIAERAAREHGLLTTGSADFHGPNHPRFNTFRAFSLNGLQPRLGRIAQ
jgi:3',5'-nucleoside bisphosphate phosphatase